MRKGRKASRKCVRQGRRTSWEGGGFEDRLRKSRKYRFTIYHLEGGRSVRRDRGVQTQSTKRMYESIVRHEETGPGGPGVNRMTLHYRRIPSRNREVDLTLEGLRLRHRKNE